MSPHPRQTHTATSPTLWRRLLNVAGASASLVGHVLGHTERLVSDVVGDSIALAQEAEALYHESLSQAHTMHRMLSSTPRFSRIVRESLQIIAAYRLHQAAARGRDAKTNQARLDALHQTNAETLYTLCVELGGGILKLGQYISTRRDLLPTAYAEALSRLQDRVPAVDTELIHQRIADAFGHPTAELFASFDDQPLAAASLAQVHAATLPSGEAVVVKVLRPGIEALIEIDLAAMAVLAPVLHKVAPQLDLPTILGVLRRSLREELDYHRELENLQRFRLLFQDDRNVCIPAAHATLCSGDVLTMERLHGRRLLDVVDTANEHERADVDAVMATLVDATARQILGHGLFHADPHPGNFIVLADGRLGILDFGCVATLSADQRQQYMTLLLAIGQRDAAAIATGLDRAGFVRSSDDPQALLRLAEQLTALYPMDGKLDQFDPQQASAAMLDLLRDQPVVSVPQSFVMLAKVLAALAGLIFSVKPNIDLLPLVLRHYDPSATMP